MPAAPRLFTVNDPVAPSSILAGVTVKAGVNEISFTVMLPLVTITVPLMLPLRTLTVNVWAPSVVLSATVVNENEPVPLSCAPPPVRENDPFTASKSALAVVTWLMVQ